MRTERSSSNLITWNLENGKPVGMVRLPNGEQRKIENLTFLPREKTGIVDKTFAKIQEQVGSKEYTYIKLNGERFKVRKEQLRGEAFHALFPNATERTTTKELQILEKKALKWFQKTLSKTDPDATESFREFSYQDRTFVLQTGEDLDIAVYKKHLGQGTFKTVDEVVFLNANKSEAKVSAKISELGKSRAKKEIKKEINTSKKLEDIPQTLKIRKITNSKKAGEQGALAEFCDKGDLGKIFQNSSITDKQKIDLLQQIAQGLHAMHDKNLMHLDIKPENMFAKTEDNKMIAMKIGDYGSVLEKDSKLKIGEAYGTPLYVAPEMLNRSTERQVSPKMDVFSFGCMLYDAISPNYPADALVLTTNADGMPDIAQYNQEIFEKTIHEKLDNTQNTDLQLTPDQLLRELVRDCVAWNPNQRPDMQSVLRRLNTIADLL